MSTFFRELSYLLKDVWKGAGACVFPLPSMALGVV